MHRIWKNERPNEIDLDLETYNQKGQIKIDLKVTPNDEKENLDISINMNSTKNDLDFNNRNEILSDSKAKHETSIGQNFNQENLNQFFNDHLKNFQMMNFKKKLTNAFRL